jgi:hypothetical protein
MLNGNARTMFFIYRMSHYQKMILSECQYLILSFRRKQTYRALLPALKFIIPHSVECKDPNYSLAQLTVPVPPQPQSVDRFHRYGQ